MGSVGDDYMCPWCGRVGAGGYAMDGINYPICTDGAHSCLNAACGGQDLKAFRARQLAVIFGRPHPVLTPDALREIASCLGPVFHTKKWVHFDASFGYVQRFLNSILLQNGGIWTPAIELQLSRLLWSSTLLPAVVEEVIDDEASVEVLEY